MKLVLDVAVFISYNGFMLITNKEPIVKQIDIEVKKACRAIYRATNGECSLRCLVGRAAKELRYRVMTELRPGYKVSLNVGYNEVRGYLIKEIEVGEACIAAQDRYMEAFIKEHGKD